MRQVVTLLYTSLVRQELFDWQDSVFQEYGGSRVLAVDTWEFQDHPNPEGNPFTLYACTIILRGE